MVPVLVTSPAYNISEKINFSNLSNQRFDRQDCPDFRPLLIYYDLHFVTPNNDGGCLISCKNEQRTVAM